MISGPSLEVPTRLGSRWGVGEEGCRPLEQVSGDSLDREFLDELLDGDREFGKELFATFSASSQECLKKVRESLHAGQDKEVLTRCFHTLKGAAISVGLLGVHMAARAFELNSSEGRLEWVNDNISRLERDVQEGLRALELYLAGV